MKVNIKLKMFIDFLMTVVLLLLMANQVTGEKFHEWFGVFMFLLFIMHNVLNIRWYGNLFRGKYRVLRIVQTLINFAVFIAMICLMYSGTVMSRYVFAALPISSGMALARVMHLSGSYWGFVLMSIHLGLHWSVITSMFRKLGEGRNLTVISWIIRFFAIIIAGYGAFCFWQADIASYLFLKVEFAFIDYEKNKVLVLLQNMAMMGLWVFIAYYMAKGIGKVSVISQKRKEKKNEGVNEMGEKISPFSGKDLRNMIVPLFLEQFLVMLVGIADTLVVSYVGEAAVSGVSLVNQFNTIFIYLFTALASGGAVVISQYIGRKDSESAGRSASQLLMFGTVFSFLIAVVVLIGNRWMLRLLFGKVEDSVMEACVTYLKISAYSYPALAIYNSGASVYRSLGKTNVTMYISVLSNIINVVGNVIGVFVLHAGVAGVAWPSLVARTFSAVVITVLCFRKKNEVVYAAGCIFKWDSDCLKRIWNIAIPNGVENGIFQLVKVALSSIVALFGTYQIAANGVAQSIWSLATLAGVAMGPAFITVIGQCMGNKDTEAADYYFTKLSKITLQLSSGWNLLILIFTPLFLRFYVLEPQTKQLVIWLVLIHNVFNAVAFPFSGALSNGLWAAGDVKFTMYVSVLSTIAGRLFLSYLLGIILHMGVIGIAAAMVSDWVIRAVIFIWRQKLGKWKEFEVLNT